MHKINTMELIFEKSVEGRCGFLNPKSDVDVKAKVDSKFKRKDDCKFPSSIILRARAHDAYDAKSFLSKLPYVDRNRIAVLGWSHGGWTFGLHGNYGSLPGG